MPKIEQMRVRDKVTIEATIKVNSRGTVTSAGSGDIWPAIVAKSPKRLLRQLQNAVQGDPLVVIHEDAKNVT